MIRLGIIGAGSIVQAHISAAIRAGFSPTVICGKHDSIRARELSIKNPGLKALSNVNNLLEEEIDALLIAVPPRNALEVIEKSLERNLPTLVEKPVSTNLQELEILTNKKISNIRVGFNRRFYSSVQLFKKEMQNKRGFLQVTLPEIPKTKDSNDMDRINSILENCVHIFDLLGYLFGDIEMCNIQRAKSDRVFDSINAQIGLNSEIIGSITILFNVPENYSIRFWSSGSSLELEPIEEFTKVEGIRVIPVEKSNSFKKYVKVKETFDMANYDRAIKPGFITQYEHFRGFVLGNSEECDLASLEDALRAMRLGVSLIGSSNLDLLATIKEIHD